MMTLLAISIIAVVLFAGLLTRELLIEKHSRDFYTRMLAAVERNPREPGTGQGAGQGDGSPVLPGDQTGQENRPLVPPLVPFLPYVDFEALDEKYPGITAWIKLDGSPIDYPVMQYTNNDHFLHHLPDGQQHRSGSVFLDYRNNKDFSDKSILIYGHESRGGGLFGSLNNYREQEYFNNNPVIELYTPEADYKIIIFAVHLAHSQRDHPPLSFTDDDDFMRYIGELKRISLVSSDVSVSPEDIIVSLCTCASDFNDARLIVAGVLRTPNGA